MSHTLPIIEQRTRFSAGDVRCQSCGKSVPPGAEFVTTRGVNRCRRCHAHRNDRQALTGVALIAAVALAITLIAIAGA